MPSTITPPLAPTAWDGTLLRAPSSGQCGCGCDLDECMSGGWPGGGETPYTSGGLAEDLAAAERQKRMLDAG
jgi:hypothetical protein